VFGFVGCKRHYYSENEPEVHDLPAKFQFQASRSLDRREFRCLRTDDVSSLRYEEIELNRFR